MRHDILNSHDTLGSIAALFQGLVYGGQTTGLFSILQSFGAVAVISPPVVIAIGVTAAAVGCGILGYKLWKWHKARRIAEHDLRKEF